MEAGLAVLPWTLAPILVAPIAGALSDRIGGGVLMGIGLTLQAVGLAWLALVSSVTVEYAALVVPFVISGVGMSLYFAPMANVILSAVRPAQEGQASGASGAIRELGGVFGVAVLATVFARQGSYASPQAFVDGMVPAVLIGAVIVALGAALAFTIPRTVGGRLEAPASLARMTPERLEREPAPVYVTRER